jgi:hypothetical protein
MMGAAFDLTRGSQSAFMAKCKKSLRLYQR